MDDAGKTMRLPQDRETPVQVLRGRAFSYRYAYARSAETRSADQVGQDYLVLRERERSIAFALCDGVGESFYGDLAARFLGDALLDWLAGDLPADLDAEGLRAALDEHLRRLSGPASELVRAQALPEGIPPLLRQALEQKRAVGSQAMFVCGRIDQPDAALPEGRLLLAWMGDSRLRLWGATGDLSAELQYTANTALRWSTRSGPVNGRPNVYIGPLRNGTRAVAGLVAYSDGLAILDGRQRPADAALNEVIAWAGGTATSDDISFLEIWWAPLPGQSGPPPPPAPPLLGAQVRDGRSRLTSSCSLLLGLGAGVAVFVVILAALSLLLRDRWEGSGAKHPSPSATLPLPVALATATAPPMLTATASPSPSPSPSPTPDATLTAALTATAQALVTPSPSPSATPSPAPTRTPTPQAGGGRIAFASDRDGRWQIWAMNADGSGLRRLSDGTANDRAPAWSPDGRRIAFESKGAGQAEIWVMNADGSGRRQLTDNPAIDTAPAWSPDGRRIAFETERDGNREIYVMDAGGTGATRLTDDPAHDLHPAWSPDGAYIVFVSDRSGAYGLWLMRADGLDPRPLTKDELEDKAPVWSPNGTPIAFTAERGSERRLALLAEPLSPQPAVHVLEVTGEDPAWSPDGAYLAYTRVTGGRSEIWAVDINALLPRRLSDGQGNNERPTWTASP